ncbi:MAG: gliding motility-associated C-terminal domain-containing protein [Saprospiraceae bacterium]|nr:gliding motility-associated C-terminal domain-containing protein [Saprospiraceae bacterium]
MGRTFTTLLLLVLCTSILSSQCPDLPSNTTVNGSTDASIDMCGAMSALFEVNDPNLPSGTIDWYSSTIAGFDPLTTGTLLGSSNIDSADPCDPGGCPTIEVIYLDACGPGDESLNEFMVIGSGSGFAVDDLSITFDVNNTFGSAGNGNINVGGVCGWSEGDLSLLSGCASLIAVGPGDYIPPNSAVIVQTSSFGTTIYDVSSMCGVSECVYVLKNSCDRNVGAFSNCGGGTGGGSTRTNSIGLTCGCNDVLVYDILDPNFVDVCMNIGSNGMHVFSDLTYANNLCNSGPNLGAIPQFSYSAITDPFNHSFTDADCNTTQYVVGVLNSTQFNTDCCSEQITNEYEFDIACITAELQGNADLCPGECAEISVVITGGESPYDLDLTITGLPFPFNNISLPFVGFPVEQKITICFDNGGPLVDESTFTVDVPAIAGGFSGSLGLDMITDATGCAGTINGSTIALSFNNAPDIVNPGDQEECDLGDGTGIFILSDLNSIINNGSGLQVNYYSDAAGTMPLPDPYITSGETIYAQVIGSPCNSEIIEFDLIVIDNGNAGFVTFFCNDPNNGPSTECTICDDDGVVGEEITLTIIFEDPNLSYDYEIVWNAISGASSTITGTDIGTATISFPIIESMTFVISVVTSDGDCPDMTDLGDVVTINYSLQPDLDVPSDLSECGSVILPNITGNSVPSNAAYYTETGGMGTLYNPGDEITSSISLFVYAGIEGCDAEYMFDVTIEEEAIIDDPDDVITCGVYALPEITGTNVDNVNYYTEIDGGGNIVNEGTIISTSVILYLFDSNCGGNQPTIDITITPGPVIENNTDTIVCDLYIVEPIIGFDLSGNEAYFDTTGGNGLIINVGDTITTDSILFIYDNTGGCEVQIPIFIQVNNPANPGLDTAIVICEGDPTLIDINDALGGSLPDTIGTWLDINNTGILSDSTQVNFSSLPIGTYLYEYQILDSICVDTQSILTVNVIGTPNAGQDASITLCSDTSGVNIFELLGNPDMSGVFLDELTMVATFDPLNASFDASVSGITIYSYIVGAPGSSCGTDTSLFTVIVEGSVNAGEDNSIVICAGNTLDLETLLSNNSSLGTFTESTSSGGLSGSTFDTENVDDGVYIIYHVLDGIGQCPSDSAALTITVSDAANAGDENEINLCGDTSISLDDYINGDEGGTYYINNMALPSGEIDFTNEVGSIDYLYIVGDGIECPFDTAIITIVRNIAPASILTITQTELCNDDCTTVSFNVANSGGQSIQLYYHIESDGGEVDNRTQNIGDLMPDTEITFCIGPGNLSTNQLQPGEEYTFVLDSIAIDNPDCIFLDGSSVQFNTLQGSTSTFTGSFCLDSEVMVGDDIYTQAMPSGVTTIEGGSQSGCDSIITVDLIFQAVAEGTYAENLCIGDSTTVNGVLYTMTNTTDSFTIPNGSINGCDSLVGININFFDTSVGTYTETICAGDTTIINGESFYEGKEMGIQTFSGQNIMGCDSILTIGIDIESSASSSFIGDYCSNFSITINGTLYDINNPIGSEVLESQATNGCDSIVDINLSFTADMIDSMLVISTCDTDFSITIGSTLFDSTNPTGVSELFAATPEECDTIVNVELIFGELGIEATEIDGGCDENSSGKVVLESSNGTAPYNLLYNGNNAIVFDLPYEIELPSGTGEISITDDNGCLTILDYEILPGGGENFEVSLSQNQLEITGGLVDSIIWSPTEGLSCSDCLNPMADPDVTTTYTATVFFGDSCFVDLSVEIVIIDDTPDFIFPSVFSPNGDNMNDNFTLTITQGATGVPQSLRIFDRWGNLVYNGMGQDIETIGWNGTFNGNEIPPGVYVYQLAVGQNEKTVYIYGDVTVVR